METVTVKTISANIGGGEKKRVLYFIPEFPRLTETFIEREVAALLERGNVDVKILSLKKASGATSQKVLDITEYKRLDWIHSFSAAVYFLTHTKKVLELFRIIPDKYLLLKSFGYTKIIEEFHPEHLHVHFLSDPSTIAMVAASLLDIPFSVSGHARDVFVEGTLIPEKADRAKFMAICNSFAWQKCIELAGPKNSSKIYKVFHGIDMNIFSGLAVKQKPNRPSIFLGGTRLVEKKGIKYVIEASRLLLDQGVDHQIDLVGPGPMYKEFKDTILDQGLENNVYIHGEGKGTPFEEVKEFYKTADIFVFPAIETLEGDADGVPTVVIEAAVAKLPIITTDAGGITDLVDDGVTGLLVPQKDAQALASAIEKLIYDKSLGKRLAEAAHKKVQTMFDLDKNVEKLEELLLV